MLSTHYDSNSQLKSAVSPSKLIYRFKIAASGLLALVPGAPKVLSAASGISNPIRTASECIGVDRLPINSHERACLNKNDGRKPISGVGATAVTVLVLATLIDLVVSAGSVSPDAHLALEAYSVQSGFPSMFGLLCVMTRLFVTSADPTFLNTIRSLRHENSACCV